MKKTVILLAIVVLWAVGAQGQRFDWAKGYGSSMQESGCRIQGSLTDSAGNLYILGQYRFDSRWDDEYLRPSEPPYFDVGSLNLLIAKITPDGTMAWKKVVQGSDQNAHSHAYDIKPLGDTGFAVMFQARNSAPGSNYLYWLDSLHMSDLYPLNPYQYADRRFAVGTFTAWLAFDFDGNVKEQYIIELSGVDTSGNDIMIQPYPHRPDSLLWLNMTAPLNLTFDVDSAGNIYICQKAAFSFDMDHRSEIGTVAAIKVWVNHREVGMFPVEKKPRWVPHLLKFAPHFDTLLNSRYVVQKFNEQHSMYSHIWIEDSTLFLIHHISHVQPGHDTLIFDTINNILLCIQDKNDHKGFITVYNSNLIPQVSLTLDDTIINQDNYFSHTTICNIELEKDSNYLFISGHSQRNSLGETSDNSLYMYNSTQLPLRNNAFVIAVDKQDYSLHSISIFPSILFASPDFSYLNRVNRNLRCKNNRIFMQASYMGGLKYSSTTIEIDNPALYGLALSVFDYQGHLIDAIDYNTFTIGHKPGPIALRDSNLYLVTHLKADADFGEHHVYAAGYDPLVCIAKYVDTSFMTPYVYVPDDSVHISYAAKQDIMVYPNPAESRLHIATHEPLMAVTAISVSGVREPLPFRDATIDISLLPAGIYILEITTPTNKYHHKIIKP